MVYVIVWWDLAWYMVRPVGHDLARPYRIPYHAMPTKPYNILCHNIACRAWHGMAYGTAWRDMEWYMIWHGGHGMVYGMAWRGMAWYIEWPGGLGMVYDKAWRDMAWYVEMLM